MSNTFKEWIVKQKKDTQTLLICFVTAFILYLIITQSFSNALEAGFGWTVFAILAINVVRFWKGMAKRVGIPTVDQYNNHELNEKEKIIFDELLLLPEIDELFVAKKIDGVIKQKILDSGYCKEDWQIHYSKERIKNAIKKQYQPSLRDL